MAFKKKTRNAATEFLRRYTHHKTAKQDLLKLLELAYNEGVASSKHPEEEIGAASEVVETVDYGEAGSNVDFSQFAVNHPLENEGQDEQTSE